MRILIAEDAEVERESLARALRQAGYDVTTAVDGREALALAAEDRRGFDLVSTEDPMLCGLAGYFLRARLSVSLPGLDRAVVEELAAAAHGICPYSKAVHGNIEVTTNVI